MRVIKPIDIIGNGELIVSNIPANDHPVYSPAATYVQGQKVTYGNLNYEALNGSNNKIPADNPLDWLNIGVTNRAAPFDEKLGTKAIKELEVSYQIQPIALVSTIALLDVRGRNATVTMTDQLEGVVYQRTIALSNSDVGDWWEYFFAPYEDKTVAIFDDLPAYAGAVIDISVTSSGTAEIGTIVTGRHYKLGVTKLGFSLGIRDFSENGEDKFGNPTLIKRGYSAKVSSIITLPTKDVDQVYRRLAGLRSTICLYITADQFESSYVYGRYKDFRVIVPTHIISTCSIELKGLT